jgi:hypothetical protein
MREVLGFVMVPRGGMARATRGVLKFGCCMGRTVVWAGRPAGMTTAVCVIAADGVCCWTLLLCVVAVVLFAVDVIGLALAGAFTARGSRNVLFADWPLRSEFVFDEFLSADSAGMTCPFGKRHGLVVDAEVVDVFDALVPRGAQLFDWATASMAWLVARAATSE